MRMCGTDPFLCRSPLARADFDLFKSFGPRLLFGMSLPTLRNDLAKVYEPKAPAPSQRLAALRAAREAGLHVYVAVAPTYPECDETDLRATLKAVAEIEPVTIFHEPINIRAENVARIEAHARALGLSRPDEGEGQGEGNLPLLGERAGVRFLRTKVSRLEPLNRRDTPGSAGIPAGVSRVDGLAGKDASAPRFMGRASQFLRTDVFATRESWQDYAVNALQTVERLAAELGLADRLHLWPDKSLGNAGVANRMPKPKEHLRWVQTWWDRISEWPE